MQIRPIRFIRVLSGPYILSVGKGQPSTGGAGETLDLFTGAFPADTHTGIAKPDSDVTYRLEQIDGWAVGNGVGIDAIASPDPIFVSGSVALQLDDGDVHTAGLLDFTINIVDSGLTYATDADLSHVRYEDGSILSVNQLTANSSGGVIRSSDAGRRP